MLQDLFPLLGFSSPFGFPLSPSSKLVGCRKRIPFVDNYCLFLNSTMIVRLSILTTCLLVFFLDGKRNFVVAAWTIHNNHAITTGGGGGRRRTRPMPGQSAITRTTTTTRLSMNILSDIGDILSGGKLVGQTDEPCPYGKPLCTTSNEETTLAVQERFVSFTGEDFDIYDCTDNSSRNKQCYTVRGAMLHLPGKDKMRLYNQRGGNCCVAVIDRKLMSLKPTYDIYRSDGNGEEKIGWIEKVTFALTDTFDVYAESSQSGGFGPFGTGGGPCYKLEGDFLDRRFVMKNAKGDVVAKVVKDQIVEFDAFNHYQIRVAPGVDSALVVACACAVDEEFDEEHRKRRKEQEQ